MSMLATFIIEKNDNTLYIHCQ